MAKEQVGATVQTLSDSRAAVRKDPNLVSVEVKYPKEYPTELRFFQDGAVAPMHPDIAAIFIDKGIGKIVD